MNVRLAGKEQVQVRSDPVTVLEFAPELTPGNWVVEVNWAVDSGNGGCLLTASGIVRHGVDPGHANIYQLSGGSVYLDCESFDSDPYTLRQLTLKATRVTE